MITGISATISGSGLEATSIVGAGDGGAESRVMIGTSSTNDSGDEGGVKGPPIVSGGGRGQRPRERGVGGSQHMHPSEESSYTSGQGLDTGETPINERPSP